MEFFLRSGTPRQSEIKKPPEQNCVYKWSVMGLQKGGVGGTGVVRSATSICVGLHEHGPLPIGRGGGISGKSSQPLMHIKNRPTGRLLVDSMAPRLHSKKPRKRVSACGVSIYQSGARRNRTADFLLAKQALSQLSYGPGGLFELELYLRRLPVGR